MRPDLLLAPFRFWAVRGSRICSCMTPADRRPRSSACCTWRVTCPACWVTWTHSSRGGLAAWSAAFQHPRAFSHPPRPVRAPCPAALITALTHPRARHQRGTIKWITVPRWFVWQDADAQLTLLTPHAKQSASTGMVPCPATSNLPHAKAVCGVAGGLTCWWHRVGGCGGFHVRSVRTGL